jgi:beta-lactamase regulating signal transducer with metallopeptidase domain
MEMLFLKILNMSITASYVILSLIFIRLLLKRAPKKYSYLLWSVVLFRLICPVSFSSVFSIFQTKPFNMTAAQ